MDKYVAEGRLHETRIKIALIGCGGTGTHCLDHLVRLDHTLRQLGHKGVHVTVYDADTVSSFNIGRQRFWAGDEGANKAMVSVSRINLYSGTDWCAVPELFDVKKMGGYWAGRSMPDVIITAVDSAAFRVKLGQELKEYNSGCLWLDCGNGDKSAQAIIGEVGDSPDKLPNVFDLYHEQLKAVDDNASPSCSMEEAIQRQDLFVNSMIATYGVHMLWTLLRKGSIIHHGVFVDLETNAVTNLNIDKNVWATFGYNP